MLWLVFSPLIAVSIGHCTPTGPASTKLKGKVSITPHQQYLSSVGVIGCKINTNRVAYWPLPVDCNNICVRLWYNGNELYLLHIDQSQKAYDISYDAWNQLFFGKPATEEPHYGGGISVYYEYVSMDNCRDLLMGKNVGDPKLPLSAANSMNFVTKCNKEPGSWVAMNHELWNINDSICTWGYDEICSLDDGANQPTCSHQLGAPGPLEGLKVIDIEAGTGRLIT